MILFSFAKTRNKKLFLTKPIADFEMFEQVRSCDNFSFKFISDTMFLKENVKVIIFWCIHLKKNKINTITPLCTD